MHEPSTRGRYTAVSKTLRWLIALLFLAGVHVLAGLKHHYLDRDDVLRRMLPGSG